MRYLGLFCSIQPWGEYVAFRALSTLRCGCLSHPIKRHRRSDLRCERWTECSVRVVAIGREVTSFGATLPVDVCMLWRHWVLV